MKDETRQNEIKSERKKWEVPPSSTVDNNLPDNLDR